METVNGNEDNNVNNPEKKIDGTVEKAQIYVDEGAF